MREFAEAEVVIPDGPYKDEKFRVSRQPYVGHWLDAIDSGRWVRHFLTAPTQCGKSFNGFVIPIMYHLFELEETVVCGVPSEEMVDDKWIKDIKPAIEASRYAAYLPTKGQGSRSGTPTLINFKNGASLRFMTAGGGDKKRAGFSSRVLVMTEIDGFDEAGGTSREADKVSQMEGRLLGEQTTRQRIYGECTVSIERGRIWQEYIKGTSTRIMLPCPYCKRLVLPEREHLRGWRECESDVAALKDSYFACPGCEHAWTERDRQLANLESVSAHKGQEITPDGTVVGEPDQSLTFSLRATAVHNLFRTAGDTGVMEWRAATAEDEENEEKKMKQFVWVTPYEPPRQEFNRLEVHRICRRVSPYARCVLPESTVAVSAGIDIGKWLHWYVVIAWTSDGSGFLVDYGSHEVPSAHLDEERAIVVALEQLREKFAVDLDRVPQVVFLDSGWKPDAIHDFCSRVGAPFWATKGFGHGEKGKGYQPPDPKSKNIEFTGHRYHGVWQSGTRFLIDVDADHWKSAAQHGFTLPIDSEESGALQLYSSPWKEHLTYAKHLTAETKVSEILQTGERVRWENPKSRANHLLDATSLACAAGHLAQMLVAAPPAAEQKKPAKSSSGGFVSRRMKRR